MPISSRHSACIVVPCFNCENTLQAALESAVCQDDVAEVIVIDDGSTDSSQAVARRFDSNIRLIVGPNRGVSAARNTGFAASSAEWVIFLDSDDLLTQGTVSARLKCASLNHAEVVICNWEDFFDGESDAGQRDQHQVFPWAAFQKDPEVAAATSAWATTGAILYSRSLIQRIGGFRLDLPVIQDARLIFDAAHRGAKFAHSDHVGAKYRLSPQSLSRRNPLNFWRDVFENGKQIEDLWRKRGALSDVQRSALLRIFDDSARVFFQFDAALFSQAVARIDSLGGESSRFVKFSFTLSSLIGTNYSRRIVGLVK